MSHSAKNTFKGAWTIARPHIAFQAALFTFGGAYLAGGASALAARPLALAALIVALVVAFGFVINDYTDVAVDIVSKPERPIPAGALSRRAAGWLALVLALLALVLALALLPQMALATLSCIALSAAYSLWLKNAALLGNLAMALLNSAILLFGAATAAAPTTLVWLAWASSFCYTMAQEVYYALADYEGDQRAALGTTAVVFGRKASLGLFRLFALLTIVVALLPWLLALAPLPYLVAVITCTALPLLAIVITSREGTPPGPIVHALRLIRLFNIVPLIVLGAVAR